MANFIIPYTTPSDFTYDSNKIEVSGGVAKLKLQNSLQSFTEDFANDTDFIYDSALAEFVGGKVQQKNKRISGATFGATFSNNINGSWGNGVLTGTAYNGASVEGGKLDLTGLTQKYVDYSAFANADSIQIGCIKFKITPNYSGTPSGNRWIFSISNTHNDNKNLISLRHSASGPYLRLNILNYLGVAIAEHLFGVWVPVAGQEYEFELNWDLTTGATRLFINGVQSGTTSIATGTRDSNIGLLRFGNIYYVSSYGADCQINDVILFSTVQHTSNYTPGYTLNEYDYLESNVILPEMEHTLPGDLTTFDSFATVESGNPRYTLQIARSGDYLYWNGSAWVVSDGSYAQANDQATFDAHFDDLDVEGETYGQFKIHFDNSNSQSWVDNLQADLYIDTGYPTDKPSIYKTTGDSIANIEEWISFVETLGINNEGSIVYQLSEDGVIWKYWDGSDWSAIGVDTYNSATVVHNNILSFPADEDKIYVKAIFLSNGLQQVELDSNEVGYVINTAPSVYAGANKNVVYNVAINPFSDCLFSDAEGNIDKAEWKIEGGSYVEIPQGTYSTLLEAIRVFENAFIHNGEKTIYLKITDSYGASTEDTLIVNVNQVTVIVNIKDSSDNHLEGVTFTPEDGEAASSQDSPFFYTYLIGTHTVQVIKTGFITLSQSIVICTEDTTVDLVMQNIILLSSLTLVVDKPDSVYAGDSFEIPCDVDIDLTGYKIRCEIFDNAGHTIKLANITASGEENQIANTVLTQGKFLLQIASGLTDDFNPLSFIEIELEDVLGRKHTFNRIQLEIKAQQIDWEIPDGGL